MISEQLNYKLISLLMSLSGLLTQEINVNTLLLIKRNKDGRVCFDATFNTSCFHKFSMC